VLSDSSFRPFISFCHCRVECKRGRIMLIKTTALSMSALPTQHVSGFATGMAAPREAVRK
jgi:hypothetical protein